VNCKTSTNTFFNISKILFATILICSMASIGLSNETDSEGLSYDSIISQLSTSKTEAPESLNTNPLDEVKFHAGLALANTFSQLSLPSRPSVTLLKRGFQVTVGIDLFSPEWGAEGGFLNYGEDVVNGNFALALREFDLKFFYRSVHSEKWGYRAGAGIAARYLKASGGGVPTQEYEIPGSILFGGIEARISPIVSIGLEIGSRNALIDNSPESGTFDAILRADARF